MLSTDFNELSAYGVHLNGAVPRGRDDVLVIEVDHVDGGPVTHEHAAQADVSRRGHVPHSDGAVFGAGHHQAVTEAQVQHGLVVVNQRVQHLTRVYVPHPVCKRDGETRNER